jgi:hypothetical protein
MKIDWDNAPEGAEAAHPGNEGFYPAWYRRDTAGIVEQICPGAGVDHWTWMGGRRDFPNGHVLRPEKANKAWSGEGLPPLESIVRIVPGDTTIWDVAEQFVGVDCRLKAVFMLDETQMVAVENIGTGQCCCFWASMVRTPEQAKAEERMNKAIALYTAVMNHPGSSLWHRLDSERQEHFLSLVDAGWQQVKP